MNILLAVDGSPYTKKMLAYLATHEELLGSQHTYTVLTVQAPLPARARAALGKEAVDSYHSEEADKILAPVCKFLARHALQTKRIAKVGPVGESIAKLADSGGVDLPVMGSHGPWRPDHAGDGLGDRPGAGPQQTAGAAGALTPGKIRSAGRVIGSGPRMARCPSLPPSP